MLDKCFPPGHHLHRLLNRNTVKVSYSCVPNVKQIISNHNGQVMKKVIPQEIPEAGCKCRADKPCPLDGKCETEALVYQAKIVRQDNYKEETYIGMTSLTFKKRFAQHTQSFKHRDRVATALSKYAWTLKDQGIRYNITWKAITRAKPYSTSSKVCNLCLKEKYYIICHPEMATLNSRNELASACLHRKRHLLRNQ